MYGHSTSGSDLCYAVCWRRRTRYVLHLWESRPLFLSFARSARPATANKSKISEGVRSGQRFVLAAARLGTGSCPRYPAVNQ